MPSSLRKRLQVFVSSIWNAMRQRLNFHIVCVRGRFAPTLLVLAAVRGMSLVFELVVLSVAAFLFCRRDF